MAIRKEIEATSDYIYLTTLLASQLVIKCLENLKGTPYYKQALKNKGNTFYEELSRITREDIPLVWGLDDENMYRCMDYIEEGILEIASIRPEEVGIRSAIMDVYRQDPERVLEMLKIGVVDKIPQP